MEPRTSLRTKLALASTSGYLSLLVAQLSLPFLAGIVVRIPFDTPFVRSTVEIARDMRTRGDDAYPLVYPGIWLDHVIPEGPELFPVSGVSHKLTVFCEEQPDKPVVYVSDPHGFRNATGGGGAIEWAAIGDSFTQGACVASGRSFVDLIARRYGKPLNLGMSGDGPLLELAALKEYLPAARPRTVVWFFYPGNDLGDLQLEKTNAILARYLEDGFQQHLVDRQGEIDRRLLQWLDAEAGRLTTSELTRLIDGESSSLDRLLEFLSLAALRRYAFPTPGQYDFALFRRVMEEARRSVETWGGRLVFVYLPDHVAVPDLPAPARADRDRTLAIVRDLHIPVIDVESSVQSVDRSELFYNSTSHYSEQGNALVAEVTVRGLLDSQ